MPKKGLSTATLEMAWLSCPEGSQKFKAIIIDKTTVQALGEYLTQTFSQLIFLLECQVHSP